MLFLLPALAWLATGSDHRAPQALAVMLVLEAIVCGLLAWNIVMEVHRRFGIGGLFGEAS